MRVFVADLVLQGYRIARPQPLSGAARADYFRVEEK